MKRKLIYLFLILFSAGVVFISCQPVNNEPAKAEMQIVADTINSMMDQITEYARKADPDSTFKYLSRDSSAIYFTGGMAYTCKELMSMFKKAYGLIKEQSIEIIRSDVKVLSFRAALWTGYVRIKGIMKDGRVTDAYFTESWVWQNDTAGWKVIHYNECGLDMPPEGVMKQVEEALGKLAAELKGKALKPDDMPSILTGFLKKNPLIYGSTLAFAPTETPEGRKKEAAPYVYRAGNQFLQTDLPAAYDYTLSEWYAVPAASGKPAWSRPYYDDGGGGVVMITYGLPVFSPGNQLVGVLTGDLELK